MNRCIASAGVALFAGALFPAWVAAAGGGVAWGEHANNDVGNVASLQRGARNFVNYCMGCHSAKYVRFSRLARDLDLSDDQVITNLMFATEKADNTMDIAMPPKDAQDWFGQTPPDLTLIARSKGTDYLFNFLRAFYIDESKGVGTNNLLLEGASMPHVLWELQGLQKAVFSEPEEEGAEPSFKEFEQLTKGTMSAEEYDQFVRDLVNFLDYTSAPEQLERKTIGAWVLLYLLVFLILAYMLKKEVWKDVK
ncbi:MAG: cytochrome c1 [Gammaproteobacteria bacterium]